MFNFYILNLIFTIIGSPKCWKWNTLKLWSYKSYTSFLIYREMIIVYLFCWTSKYDDALGIIGWCFDDYHYYFFVIAMHANAHFIYKSICSISPSFSLKMTRIIYSEHWKHHLFTHIQLSSKSSVFSKSPGHTASTSNISVCPCYIKPSVQSCTETHTTVWSPTHRWASSRPLGWWCRSPRCPCLVWW